MIHRRFCKASQNEIVRLKASHQAFPRTKTSLSFTFYK